MSLQFLSEPVHASAGLTTGDATSITHEGAILSGTSGDPNGTFAFAVGTSADLSGPVYDYVGSWRHDKILYIRGGTSFDLNNWTPSGDGPTLLPATTYYWRFGRQTGPDSCIFQSSCYSWADTKSFSTRAAVLPESSTGESSLVGATTASLSGSVTPNDGPVAVSFEYGTTEALTTSSASETQNVAKGSTSTPITKALTNLSPETTYYYRIVATSPYGTVRGVIKSFTTTPPVGVSINKGANYTTSKNVELSISWPVGATDVLISNDGGFRASDTTKAALSTNTSWVLDDSVSGVYTKIVYVRFTGPEIDSSRTYQDDIIFDNKPPSVTSSGAEQSGTFVIISLAAKDEESGLATVEVNNVDKTVNADYATTVLVKASDLGLGVSSSRVKALALGNLRIRIADKAGNRTAWITLGGASTTSGKTASTSTATALKVNSSQSTNSVLAASKVVKPKGGRLTVSTSSSICRVVGGRIFALKAGTCTLKVRITTATKKTTTRTLRVQVRA
jgi:hypothetical protein